MNSHERSVRFAAIAGPSHWSRRQVLAVVIATLIVAGASGYLALRYFTSCASCDKAPILCTDPCTLPTFGQARLVTDV